MALDFPSSPTTGQTYTGSDGTTWKWDGAKWVSAMTSAPISAQQLDLGTRLAAAGTKLNALGPTPIFNGQSAASTNTALDAALNYYSGASINYEWDLPAAAPGMCLGVYVVNATGSCTIRPAAGDQIVAPGNAYYTNAAPLILPPMLRGMFATIVLIGRFNAWDILSVSSEIAEAMGWVTHPYFAGLYNGATVGITASTYTKCTIDTVQFDSHGWWDSANKRYIPKRPGKYMAVYEANIGANGAGSGPTVIQAAVYLNGAQASSRIISFNGTAFLPYQNFLGVTSIVACNGTTDYIEPWVYVGGGSAPAILGGATNQFFVTYLGP